MYDFEVGESEYLDLFRKWMVNAVNYVHLTKRGAVIMCHPSCPITDIPANDLEHAKPYDDPIAEARLREYQVLTNLKFTKPAPPPKPKFVTKKTA